MRTLRNIAIMLLFFATISIAQEAGEITNIKIQKLGNGILTFTYDLWGDTSYYYDVTFSIYEEYKSQPIVTFKTYEGEAGDDIVVGKNKQVQWNVEEDAPNLLVIKRDRKGAPLDLEYLLWRGDYIIGGFADGDPKDSGGLAWYIYAGGASIVGGVIAAVLLSQEEDPVENGGGGDPSTGFPLPPARD